MERTDSRKIAVAGIIVAAVLSACLILPAVGQLATIEGTWLAAAILGLPTVAVLVATGYRHYGLGRSIAVAVVIMAVTLIASWVLSVFILASALGGSATPSALGVLLYVVPAALVLVLGLVALKVVPPRVGAERRLTAPGAGKRTA